MAFIKSENLKHKFFRRDDSGEVVDEILALDGVDLEVEPGQFIAILGHNGSGKSTFAKHLNVLLSPTEGSLWVDGKDVKNEDLLLEIRQTAGMIFQNPDNQIVAGVVEEDVAFGPENMGVPTEEICKRVDESLEAVDMTEYRLHSPNRLSGGQKQRVAVAGVVAMHPKCIVMDEPTAMLDPNGRREVLKTVHRLNREESVTVILITHYMEEVTDADLVFVMDRGRVVMRGTPREIFSRVDELHDLGLDVPQITRLAYELKKDGVPLPDGVLNRQELKEALVGNLGKIGNGETDSESFCNCSLKTQESAVKSEYARAVIDGLSGQNLNHEHQENASTANQVASHVEMESGQDFSPQKEQAILKMEADAFDEKSARMKCDTTPKIRLEDVTFTYSPKTAYEMHALKNVRLEFGTGEFIGIIGHTGSGKSTLIQLLNGLLRPTSGKVFYDGQDIFAEGFSLRGLRSKVGLVFQYPEYQLFETTVLRDVAFGPKNQGCTEEEALEKAREALLKVKLPEQSWEMSPFELSGGQKRRAAIAGVIAMEPDVLILDEPTAGLDPRGRDELFALICELHEKMHMTVLLVSHSMEDVAAYVGRIVVMNHGEVMLDGTPSEVFAHVQELEGASLAAPQVTYLMEELRAEGMPVRSGVTTLQEARTEIRKVFAAGK